MRVIGPVLFLLAILLSPSMVAQQDCGVCDGSRHVDCLRCQGQGLRATTCRKCEGAGRYDCRRCRRAGGKSTPGRIDCSNCDKGRVTVHGKKLRCKPCRGSGALKCPECVSGKVRCVCRGKDKAEPCRDCAGHGRLPCPGCARAPTGKDCVLCQGAPKRTCGVCANAPRKSSACLACEGRGGSFCRKCRGFGKSRCRTCRGTGQRAQRRGRRGKVDLERCQECGGKGVDECSNCTDGLIPCDLCVKGKRKNSCGHCRSGTVQCPGCRPGPETGLEILAHYLIDEERYAEALVYFRKARERVQAAVDEIRTELDPPKKEEPDEEDDGKKGSGKSEKKKAAGDDRKKRRDRARLQRMLTARMGALRRLDREISEVSGWLPRAVKPEPVR